MIHLERREVSKYFTKKELGCKHCGMYKFSSQLLAILHKGRVKLGAPIVIRSGCRCKFWNKHEGGSETSSHLVSPSKLCTAVDLKCLTDVMRARLRNIFYELGVRRFGYGKTFLHIIKAVTSWVMFIFFVACILALLLGG
jgi:hypothetical protein